MTLYEKIDFLCESRTITRKELAKQTGISYATLNSMFARQSTNISLETIRTIATYFNVSLDYLLKDEVEPIENSTKKATPEQIESSLTELFQKHGLFDDVSDKKLDLIDRLIMAVLESDID